MSDIAMLVAEEYERRVKHSRRAAGGGGNMEMNRVSCASVMDKIRVTQSEDTFLCTDPAPFSVDFEENACLLARAGTYHWLHYRAMGHNA
ncbi:hypothetical protein SADUNF_Sadunf05G0054700 [Salix dunnii]|uniref:Uncharacterized protein n=1 Tax=Salix dunnii TaxID=1413687 RepID=A0A835K4L9_9ROSI|nr:hypothetical protein SADUNF_Sadunf05G0054700 [Salix dunnii]